jgi:hypothetical protein
MGDDSDAMRNVYDVFLKKHWDILGCSENGDSNNKTKNKKTILGCQPAKNYDLQAKEPAIASTRRWDSTKRMNDSNNNGDLGQHRIAIQLANIWIHPI